MGGPVNKSQAQRKGLLEVATRHPVNLNKEKTMDEVLERIAEFAKDELNNNYGFVGVMKNNELIILNSSDKNGNDIKITIQLMDE